jgi:hypothetical protein
MIRSRLAAVAAGLLAAGTVTFAAAPAFATTPLPACTPAASAPLYTAPCLPVVTGTNPGPFTVTLPGVGTLMFSLKPDGTIDPTSVTPNATGANFTATTPVVSEDGMHVSVTFINAANPVQKYEVRAKVIQTNPTTVGGAPGFAVVSKARPAGEGDDNEQGDENENEQGDHEDGGKGAPAVQPAGTHQDDQESSSGGSGGHSGGESGGGD